MTTVVAPMLMPFVVKAEPTSKNESSTLMPMVEKTRLRIIRTAKNPIMLDNAAFSSSGVGLSPFFRTALMRVWMRAILIPPAMLKVQPPAKPTRMKSILAGRVVETMPKGGDSIPVDDAMLTTLNNDSKGFTHAKMQIINAEPTRISRYNLISGVKRLRSFRWKRL